MKKLTSVIAILLLFSTIALSQDGTTTNSINLSLILAILAACYEAISRLIKTNKTWSIIGKLLEVLTWLSDLFDRKRKK